MDFCTDEVEVEATKQDMWMKQIFKWEVNRAQIQVMAQKLLNVTEEAEAGGAVEDEAGVMLKVQQNQLDVAIIMHHRTTWK